MKITSPFNPLLCLLFLLLPHPISAQPKPPAQPANTYIVVTPDQKTTPYILPIIEFNIEGGTFVAKDTQNKTHTFALTAVRARVPAPPSPTQPVNLLEAETALGAIAKAELILRDTPSMKILQPIIDEWNSIKQNLEAGKVRIFW